MTGYFAFSFVLFFVGFFGMIVTRNNLVLILMAMEIMSLALSFSFVISAGVLDDSLGHLFALVIMCAAGADVAVGLAVLLVFYRLRGVVSMGFMSALKG